MANRTDPRAHQIHGTNPQFLVDKIIRLKIHNDPYYKEKCFALTAETLVDRAIELKYVSGTYGGTRRPSQFLCLILKMLQIQPEDEIVLEFIKNKDYKYIRALGAFYWRLVAPAKDVYKVLEPLYSDYRRLVYRTEIGQFEVMHMDEFIDKLLREDIFCEVTLPRISKRHVLEEEGVLEPYVSALNIQDEYLQEVEEQEEEKQISSQVEQGELQQQLSEVDLKEKKGRGNTDDWNQKKLTDQVISRKDGRDPLNKKQQRSSSSSSYSSSSGSSSSRSSYSSYSSSSQSYRDKRKHKDNKGKRREEKERYKGKSRQQEKKGYDSKKPEAAELDKNSDQYWIELRKKLGMKTQ